MTKGKRYEYFKNRRNKLKIDIDNTIKKPNGKTKFEKLIKLSKEYESLISDMNLEGFSGKVYGKKYETKYWIEVYNEFKNGKSNKKIVTDNKIQENNMYDIILCWTIKHDYCVCEPVIEKIQNYFKSINISAIDLVKTNFIDRVEFCETYRLECTKEKFDLILKSAEYILDITADSIYDKCNIGIFGKSL